MTPCCAHPSSAPQGSPQFQGTFAWCLLAPRSTSLSHKEAGSRGTQLGNSSAVLDQEPERPWKQKEKTQISISLKYIYFFIFPSPVQIFISDFSFWQVHLACSCKACLQVHLAARYFEQQDYALLNPTRDSRQQRCSVHTPSPHCFHLRPKSQGETQKCEKLTELKNYEAS